jgi:hypothetical protein|nr:MAG TPA: hypothetical protein [Bacteriophage sp.]
MLTIELTLPTALVITVAALTAVITTQYITYTSSSGTHRQKIGSVVLNLLMLFPGIHVVQYIHESSLVGNILIITTLMTICLMIPSFIIDNYKAEKKYRDKLFYQAMHYDMFKAQLEAK